MTSVSPYLATSIKQLQTIPDFLNEEAGKVLEWGKEKNVKNLQGLSNDEIISPYISYSNQLRTEVKKCLTNAPVEKISLELARYFRSFSVTYCLKSLLNAIPFLYCVTQTIVGIVLEPEEINEETRRIQEQMDRGDFRPPDTEVKEALRELEEIGWISPYRIENVAGQISPADMLRIAVKSDNMKNRAYEEALIACSVPDHFTAAYLIASGYRDFMESKRANA